MTIRRATAFWVWGFLITAALCLASPHSARAQEEFDLVELEMRIDTFFQDLSDTDKKAEEVFSDFLKNGHLADRTKDIKKMALRFENLKEKYGTYLEHEQITAKSIGKQNDLVLFKYLYKTTKYPIVWTFDFYSAPETDQKENTWVIIAIGFSTQLDSLR